MLHYYSIENFSCGKTRLHSSKESTLISLINSQSLHGDICFALFLMLICLMETPNCTWTCWKWKEATNLLFLWQQTCSFVTVHSHAVLFGVCVCMCGCRFYFVVIQIIKMGPLFSVLACLRERFSQGHYYTNAGATVVAVNPFTDVSYLYSLAQIQAYHTREQVGTV